MSVSSQTTPMTAEEVALRRVRARRTAIVLGCIAFAFYVAFIAMSVARA